VNINDLRELPTEDGLDSVEETRLRRWRTAIRKHHRLGGRDKLERLWPASGVGEAFGADLQR
jgi:hypothetical protein